MSVEIDKNGDFWTIINDRSDARNAVDTDHAKALVSAFDAFENGPAKVAVFWGRGEISAPAGTLNWQHPYQMILSAKLILTS